MKTKIMSLALAAFATVSVLNAQESNQPAHKTVFAKDGAGSHWFVELGNAASVNFGGYNGKASFGDRISYLNPTLSIGRYHKPYFATRLSFIGGELKDYARFMNTANPVMGKNTYAMGHLDFMFDVVNYFSPYKENRVVHFIPFVGVGAGYMWKSDYAGVDILPNRWTPTAHLGAQLKFRLSSRVDLNLEAQAIANDFRQAGYFDDESKEPRVKGGVIGTLGANLTIHLGKKAFTPIVPEDAALLARLNGDLNALRAENAELRKRPTHCPEVVPQTAAPVVVGNVVYFRLNSAVVDANQMINVYNVAQYAKNNTETITLVGFADRQTGTPEYNYKLSERRAEAVKKILVEKYGISADRIKTSWEGDRVQPYAENVWNRVVLMNAE